MLQLLRVEQVGQTVGMYIAQWNKILLGLMLNHGRNQIVDTTSLTKEDLALSVLHIFLDVQSNSLGNTEILHVLRNVDSELLGHVEEMVNGMTRGKYDGSVIQDVHLLCTEIFRADCLDLDERTENQFNTKLVRNIEIWRLLTCWLRL